MEQNRIQTALLTRQLSPEQRAAPDLEASEALVGSLLYGPVEWGADPAKKFEVAEILRDAEIMLGKFYENRPTTLGEAEEKAVLEGFAKQLVEERLLAKGGDNGEAGSVSTELDRTIEKGLKIEEPDEVVVPEPTSTGSPLTRDDGDPRGRRGGTAGRSFSDILEEAREREPVGPSGGRFR